MLKTWTNRFARIAPIVCMFLTAGMPHAVSAQTESGRSNSSDSSRAAPQEISSRNAWEKVVSFPGTVVFLPFKIFFEGVERSAGAIDESKIVPRTIDFLTADDGSRALFPTYASRTGGGVAFYQRNLLKQDSKLTGMFTVGIRRRQHYELRFQRLRFLRGAIEMGVRARYRLLSDERFFGIGPESMETDESNFAHEQTVIEAALAVYFGQRSGMSLELGYHHDNVLRGRNSKLPSTTNVYSQGSLAGLETEIRLARVGLTFEHDSRDRLENPTRGLEVLFGGSFYDDLDGNRFGFYQLSLDASRYVHLFYNRVLVVRAAAQLTEPFSNRDVPFYRLSEFGSRETVRGYTRGRFRDRDMIIGSLEYRYPIWQRIDAVLFVDGGKVSNDMFSDLSRGDIQWSYGGGVRIWSSGGAGLRLEIAKGLEELRFHFSLN